ncbi:hypothetical protein [Acinetobacter sp. A47]|uniref:hypothetical protein n=1 Tax=Acinetobacter sp. A47 TaxID=1561217 RepID=UPI00126A7A9F|nr:hypothetical protein [Acinetobacter sp. A47]
METNERPFAQSFRELCGLGSGEVLTKFNGERIEYHPNVIVDINYNDDDQTYTFDIYHSGKWHYGYTRLDQVHQIALKQLEGII